MHESPEEDYLENRMLDSQQIDDSSVELMSASTRRFMPTHLRQRSSRMHDQSELLSLAKSFQQSRNQEPDESASVRPAKEEKRGREREEEEQERQRIRSIVNQAYL